MNPEAFFGVDCKEYFSGGITKEKKKNRTDEKKCEVEAEVAVRAGSQYVIVQNHAV